MSDKDESEVLRQAHVFASGLLARAGDARLQAITDEAAIAFNVPVAAIIVTDRGRQYLPVSTGFGLRETDLTLGFCDHAIDNPGAILCVPNTLDHPRFADSPLVTGPMHVRFYAGLPLSSDGRPAVGTLCLMDQTSRRPLTEMEQRLFWSFGTRCLAEIETGRGLMRHGQIDGGRDLTRYGQDVIELVLRQIESAIAQGNDRLAMALDTILQQLESGRNLVRYGQEAIDAILKQIEKALAQGNDRLVVALDAVLAQVQGEIGIAARLGLARQTQPTSASKGGSNEH